ncbi:UDP-N-acetylmuramoyl-L-alanine--D-glutamate ligase [Deferribacterales bacterium RsTz2092]|nr:UDP-N-acetylmuramoylalanine--D-glutamate ligase [Deferribacterales bacterium]
MGKDAAIIGLGKSGLAAKRLLELDGYAPIDIYDDNRAIMGAHPIANYKDDYEITVVSPGVNPKQIKVPISNRSSELELAYKYKKSNAKILGVTGTNGKSTVCHLTTQILNAMGKSAISVGNFGYPFADAVLDKPADYYVLELSSFQIELLRKGQFSLDGLVFTNLTEDHLDRYGSYECYANAKFGVFDFLAKDSMLAIPDNRKIKEMADAAGITNRLVVDISSLYVYKGSDVKALNFGTFSLDLAKYRLVGLHNAENLAFSLVLIASVTSLVGDVTELINVKELTGLPHRLELVRQRNEVSWINDSKSTTVESTSKAISSCHNSTLLLLGGKDKQLNYGELAGDIEPSSVKLVIVFGEAREAIAEHLKGGGLKKPLFVVNKLKDAVSLAAQKAQKGWNVLLSPACSSYDEFKNFEERGVRFAQYIDGLSAI